MSQQPQYQPQTTQGMACMICGHQGTLRPGHTDITRKRRVKFGFFWLVFSVITCGIGFLLWLVWPRGTEVISTDRFVVCTNCGAKQ